MLLTANSLAQGAQKLNYSIVEKPDTATNKTFEEIWGNLKSLSIRNEEAVIDVAHWLGQSRFVTKLDYKVMPAVLYQDHPLSAKYNVPLSFALADNYAAHFILLKSFFRFGGNQSIIISVDPLSKVFTLEILTNKGKEIVNYLDTLFNWLDKEIRFKSVLRGIIQFEKMLKTEQGVAYQNLRVVA